MMPQSKEFVLSWSKMDNNRIFTPYSACAGQSGYHITVGGGLRRRRRRLGTVEGYHDLYGMGIS